MEDNKTIEVNLGLSVKWADRNVGAISPTDYGDYFSWAETETQRDCCRQKDWCLTMMEK